MKKFIILKFLKSIEDNYFDYNSLESIRLRVNTDKTEIDIIGKDSDDSDEVLDSIHINEDITIAIRGECILINNECLYYAC